MKAYKGLEAYNQVLVGWVTDVKTLTTSGFSLVKGKVRISGILNYKFIEYLIENNSYLNWRYNLEYFSKENHEYYHQIQTQLLVTGLQNCHFFVWTMTDYALVVVEANKKLQDEIVSKSALFFENVLLKELLAKHFTENKLPDKFTNTMMTSGASVEWEKTKMT